MEYNGVCKKGRKMINKRAERNQSTTEGVKKSKRNAAIKTKNPN